MTLYYEDDLVTLWHGDCREVDSWRAVEILVTDPPYPNNGGHFDAAVATATGVVSGWVGLEAVIFWSELHPAPSTLPLVAAHVWHRTNVNGRPYETAWHFAVDGRKRRSLVLPHSVPFPDATGSEYAGHPTQKPSAVMRRLVGLVGMGAICDPFAGSGSTLVAAKAEGRRAIGVEIEERYCEIAAKRLAQGVLDFEEPA